MNHATMLCTSQNVFIDNNQAAFVGQCGQYSQRAYKFVELLSKNVERS
jgi:hypothetical protein